MILEKTPLSMAEALDIAKNQEDKNQEVIDFINKFNKIKPANAKKLKKELESLEIIKINQERTSTMIDLAPTTAVELNKIFANESLEEDEVNKILEIIKKYV